MISIPTEILSGASGLLYEGQKRNSYCADILGSNGRTVAACIFGREDIFISTVGADENVV